MEVKSVKGDGGDALSLYLYVIAEKKRRPYEENSKINQVRDSLWLKERGESDLGGLALAFGLATFFFFFFFLTTGGFCAQTNTWVLFFVLVST